MKNIKDITISIFAIIGFVTILSSFNSQTELQVTHGTPESHVWEFHTDRSYSLNKVTGEVRVHDSRFNDSKKFMSVYAVSNQAPAPK